MSEGEQVTAQSAPASEAPPTEQTVTTTPEKQEPMESQPAQPVNQAAVDAAAMPPPDKPADKKSEVLFCYVILFTDYIVYFLGRNPALSSSEHSDSSIS